MATTAAGVKSFPLVPLKGTPELLRQRESSGTASPSTPSSPVGSLSSDSSIEAPKRQKSDHTGYSPVKRRVHRSAEERVRRANRKSLNVLAELDLDPLEKGPFGHVSLNGADPLTLTRLVRGVVKTDNCRKQRMSPVAIVGHHDDDGLKFLLISREDEKSIMAEIKKALEEDAVHFKTQVAKALETLTYYQGVEKNKFVIDCCTQEYQEEKIRLDLLNSALKLHEGAELDAFLKAVQEPSMSHEVSDLQQVIANALDDAILELIPEKYGAQLRPHIAIYSSLGGVDR